MRLNDRLVWVLMGSILLVGAFLVGILIGLPDGGRSSVQAQSADDEPRSTTRAVDKVAPTPLPPPTAADLDRWEREWQESSGAGIQTIEVSAEVIKKNDSGYGVSWIGDRELVFRDETSVELPSDVEIIHVLLMGMCGSTVCPTMPVYTLQRGSATVGVDSTGVVLPNIEPTDDRSAFSFLFDD